MAKKRATATGKSQASDSVRRTTVVTIKGTDEWKDWLNGLSDHLRIPTSTVVDLALVLYARENGYRKDPPKR
jgi:hypothetical protein